MGGPGVPEVIDPDATPFRDSAIGLFPRPSYTGRFCSRFYIDKTHELFGGNGIEPNEVLAFRLGFRVATPRDWWERFWLPSNTDYDSESYYFINDPDIVVHFVPAGYMDNFTGDESTNAQAQFQDDVEAIRSHLLDQFPFRHDKEFWDERIKFLAHGEALDPNADDPKDEVQWRKVGGLLVANPFDSWKLKSENHGHVDAGLVTLIWDEGRGFAISEALDYNHEDRSENDSLKEQLVWDLFFSPNDGAGPFLLDYETQWATNPEVSGRGQFQNHFHYQFLYWSDGRRFATAPVKARSTFPAARST